MVLGRNCVSLVQPLMPKRKHCLVFTDNTSITQKSTLKKQPTEIILKLKLTFETLGALHDLYYLDCISRALKQSFGTQGQATRIDMVLFIESDGVAYIKVYTEYEFHMVNSLMPRCVQMVWSALTMLGAYDGQKCRFDVCITNEEEVDKQVALLRQSMDTSDLI